MSVTFRIIIYLFFEVIMLSLIMILPEQGLQHVLLPEHTPFISIYFWPATSVLHASLQFKQPTL